MSNRMHSTYHGNSSSEQQNNPIEDMLLLQSPGVATSDYNYPFHREILIFSVLNKSKNSWYDL